MCVDLLLIKNKIHNYSDLADTVLINKLYTEQSVALVCLLFNKEKNYIIKILPNDLDSIQLIIE